MRDTTQKDDDMVDVCPECDLAASVRVIHPSGPQDRYRCDQCSAHFPEPEQRERKQIDSSDTGRGGSLVSRLSAADPEEWP